jgi:hypothetical protein
MVESMVSYVADSAYSPCPALLTDKATLIWETTRGESGLWLCYRFQRLRPTFPRDDSLSDWQN